MAPTWFSRTRPGKQFTDVDSKVGAINVKQNGNKTLKMGFDRSKFVFIQTQRQHIPFATIQNDKTVSACFFSVGVYQ